MAPALALLDDATATVGTPEDAPMGLVQLGATRLAIQMFVAPTIEQLARGCPHVTLDLRTVERPGDLI